MIKKIGIGMAVTLMLMTGMVGPISAQAGTPINPPDPSRLLDRLAELLNMTVEKNSGNP